MATDRISAELTEEAFARVNAALAEIKAALPFLIDLSTEERKSLPKFGDKSVAFVNKSAEFAVQHSDVLPARLSLTEFNKDVKLYNQLFSITQTAKALVDKIEDTYLQVGAEAYSTALVVYANLKANKNLFESSELVLDELSKRFLQKTKSENVTADAI
jgi:hypothetical protein